MTTLLHSGTRRCNATCHDARNPKCHCICGGALHGRGVLEAFAALEELATAPEDVRRADIQPALFREIGLQNPADRPMI